jgi:hypothetical protein
VDLTNAQRQARWRQRRKAEFALLQARAARTDEANAALRRELTQAKARIRELSRTPKRRRDVRV